MDNLIELLNVFRSDKTAFLFNYIIQITRRKSNRKGSGHLHRKYTVFLKGLKTLFPPSVRILLPKSSLIY